MSDGPLQVAILYNASTLPPGHPDHAAEAEVGAVAEAIAASLAGAGFHVWEVAAGKSVDTLLRRLIDPRPDVVFNLIEAFAGRSAGEAHVTGLLELLGLAYTGCPPNAQALGHSKSRTKALLRGAGLPTAAFALVRPGDPVPAWPGPWPAIVKPDAEDASLGIGQASVVEGPDDLADAVDRLRASHPGDVLVEAYLPGREFNVGLLGLPELAALPVAEIVYDLPGDQWPILTYDAKWAEGSPADLGSVPECPADIPPALATELAALAVAAGRITGCRDYARVDCRLDADGRPMILEVNPNPAVGPDAGWARAVRASGEEYDFVLAALVNQAYHRAERGRHGG